MTVMSHELYINSEIMITNPAMLSSFAITLFGAFVNLALSLHLINTWRSIDSDSEAYNALKIISALLSVYFAAASSVSFIGFFAVLKVLSLHLSITPFSSFSE
jgi:hypothetical protein